MLFHIMNVRGIKKTADIPGISHGRVEGYIKTIPGKISANSQEGMDVVMVFRTVDMRQY